MKWMVSGEQGDQSRSQRSRVSIIAVLFGALVFTAGVWAAEDDRPYGTRDDVDILIDELVAEEGFKKAELDSVFAEARRVQSILDAISRPAEKRLAWHQYRKIFVTPDRAAQGLDYLREHRAALERAERELGVPAEVVVAILGVETRYGRHTGGYRVLDALSTLAFDYPKRAKFFRSELKHFLVLAREQGFEPSTLTGSYAGAMGLGQFMPSSFRAYAIDFDGDDVIDIWNNPVDAIGSIANYFNVHGWREGEPVVTRATVRANYREDRVNGNLKPKHTVADLRAANIYPDVDFPAESKATALRFDGANGEEFWMGLHNFYVITRYNHSPMYAMSVYQLSEEIRALVVGA